MRRLLRSRRGSVAFATTIAMVPLIGVLALGGEAGSWYVTKQNAQNAADAAAYAGALNLACSLVASSCTDAKSVDYRGKQFAAQNAFCNPSGDPSFLGSKCSSLPTGTSRSVQIASLMSWNGGTGHYVQATVGQQQPAYLAKVLGLSTVNIAATAVAAVTKLAVNPCVLALGGPITFQDNGITVTSPTCGFGSNFAGPGASIDFKNVSASNVQLGPSQASGSCTGTAALCQKVSPYLPPVIDPYAALNAALATLNLPACPSGGAPYSYSVTYTATTGPCANKDFTLNGSQSYALSGTYFFSGTQFTMKGNSSNLTTAVAGATIILLPGVETGKSNHINMSLKAPNTPPTALPASLQPFADLIGATAIYDTETDAKKFTGITTITVTNGIMYYPNQTLTFSGNSTINVNGCSELIAKQITFAGSVNFTTKGCPQTALPTAQIVKLVQ